MKKYILALLASISCFAAFGFFSASAEATLTFCSLSEVPKYKSEVSQAVTYLNSTLNSSEYYVIFVAISQGSTDASGCCIGKALYSSDAPVTFDLSVYQGSCSPIYTSRSLCLGNSPTSAYNNNWNSDQLCFDSPNRDYYIIANTVPVIYKGEVHNPFDPDAPFSVEFQPELFEGMSPNTVSYPSKQGANGQNVTSELYDIDVTVSLTDSFLNQTVPISGSFIYSYYFTTFIVPAQFCDGEDIRTMSEHAIYTSVTQDHYLYKGFETLDVDLNSPSILDNDNIFATGDNTPVAQQWACAEGATNCYVISRSAVGVSGTNTKKFTIDLEHVPFEDSGYTSFKIVTLGHLTRLSEYGWVAYPYYLKSSCPDLAFKSKKEYPAEFPTGDEGDYTKWELYDYYTVVSDAFSYNTYPPYYEQTDKDGQAFSKTPLDFRNVAAKVQDYEMHVQTGGQTEWMTESEFEDHLKQKEWGEKFSADYDVGDLTGLFNGESTFFGFITASLSVLPSWFMTVLTTFFVTLLAVIVIKFLV